MSIFSKTVAEIVSLFFPGTLLVVLTTTIGSPCLILTLTTPSSFQAFSCGLFSASRIAGRLSLVTVSVVFDHRDLLQQLISFFAEFFPEKFRIIGSRLTPLSLLFLGPRCFNAARHSCQCAAGFSLSLVYFSTAAFLGVRKSHYMRVSVLPIDPDFSPWQ